MTQKIPGDVIFFFLNISDTFHGCNRLKPQIRAYEDVALNKKGKKMQNVVKATTKNFLVCVRRRETEGQDHGVQINSDLFVSDSAASLHR